MKAAIPVHTLDELCALVDLPRRTVRYYIQIGLVDRPKGETRAARYSARHVEQLLKVRKWTDAGVSLDRIRDLLSGEPPSVPPKPRARGQVEVWSHVLLADGVELMLDPARAAMTPAQVRAFVRGTLALHREVTNTNDPKDER